MRMLDGEGVGGERVGIHMRLLHPRHPGLDEGRLDKLLQHFGRAPTLGWIVTPLLYGSGFSLDNFKKNRGGVVNCMTNCR